MLLVSLHSLALLMLALPSSRQLPADAVSTVRGRIVDARGEPLPEGTVLRGRLEMHIRNREEPLPHFFFNPALVEVQVGTGGCFTLTLGQPMIPARPGRGVLSNSNYTTWLQIERALENDTRERIFVPLRADSGTLTFEREELLARVRVVDDRGSPLPDHSTRLEVHAQGPLGPPANARLGVRWKGTSDPAKPPALWELWGFRWPGAYSLVPSYGLHGPSGEPVPLVLGAEEVVAVLPATGHLQLRMRVPEPFPERSVFAVVEDLERAATERRALFRNDAYNLRLLLGRHRIHYELNGIALTAPEIVEVEHLGTREMPLLDLRQRTRVFTIEVVDPEGQPIPASRVRVVGSPDPPASRQHFQRQEGRQFLVLVATCEQPVDLEVSEEGTRFEPRILTGVDGDRVVVLQPVRR